MPDVLMPRLTDSMEEGTIVAWLVDDGEPVSRGQAIVEIETDKATTEWEADADGVLRIVADLGQCLPPGAPIARLGPNDGPAERPSRAEARATTPSRAAAGTEPGTSVPAAQAAGPAASDDPPSASAPTASSSSAASTPAATASPASPASTPAATASAPPAEASAPAAPSPDDDVHDGTTLRDPSRIESIIATRMVRSRTEMPSFTVTVDADVEGLLAHRIEMKRGASGRTVPSVNDLIVRACAIALRDHPRVNAAWTEAGIVERERVHVGVAVATDDGGLVVPVVRDADRVPLSELAATSRALTKRARAGKITPADLEGGTFTVSNLGPFGVRCFDAIVSPGQAAILAVGAVRPAVVARDGEPVVRQVVTLSLSSDHRVVYGAHAASYLERVRGLLEHPAALAL